ncbi:MAG: NAD-dependent epimerase/dehydratase family protein [Deltaproteobacteria bacterium]|nr:NAD-dependent epimerase/dehydratase family protein [Deltaproteobacteria bacterium]
MTSIAITGVNSYFAKTVLPKLEADPEIERIVGIDVTPWTSDFKKVAFFQEDVRSDNLPNLLKNVDTVLHLAFIVNEIHDKKKTHEININGSKNVFKACVENNVKKIIYTSSIASYGAHPDNPIGITENYPLVENRDSYYSTDKVAVETFLARFFEKRQDITLTIFRPPVIVGPNLNNQFVEGFNRKTTLFIKGRDPQLQFLHEDDLGEALYLAVKKDIPGIFNIAADDETTMRRLYELAEIKSIDLPAGLLKFIANLLFALRLQNMSQGWISLMEYPIIVSSEKFKKVTGWQPFFGFF